MYPEVNLRLLDLFVLLSPWGPFCFDTGASVEYCMWLIHIPTDLGRLCISLMQNKCARILRVCMHASFTPDPFLQYHRSVALLLFPFSLPPSGSVVIDICSSRGGKTGSITGREEKQTIIAVVVLKRCEGAWGGR